MSDARAILGSRLFDSFDQNPQTRVFSHLLRELGVTYALRLKLVEEPIGEISVSDK